ncbi:MAG: hypothetical protein AAGF76_10355 [Pseudomonadota bacterium]
MRRVTGSVLTMSLLLSAGFAAAQDGAEGAAQDPVPKAASEPVSPEEFRDYAEGYTLYFERDGEPWGSESFEPDGSVTWRFPIGTCIQGVWSGHQGRVCFYYGEGDEVMCWAMRREEGVLRGRLDETLPSGELVEDADGMELTITHRDRAPLLCSEEGAAL